MVGSVSRRAGKPRKRVSTPYKPTARETAALDAQSKRLEAACPAPSLILVTAADGKEHVELDHPDFQTGYRVLAESLGISDGNVLSGFLRDIWLIGQIGDKVDIARANYVLGIVRGINPQDQVEAMIGAQMAAVHLATMRYAALVAVETNLAKLEVFERGMNRLSRTFATLVETLKRYRSKGEQRVIVERVTVNQGGQAIVGNVEHGGRVP